MLVIGLNAQLAMPLESEILQLALNAQQRAGFTAVAVVETNKIDASRIDFIKPPWLFMHRRAGYRIDAAHGARSVLA